MSWSGQWPAEGQQPGAGGPYPPSNQGGYPPSGQGGYPPGQGGIPPPNQGGYPPGQGGYPPPGPGGGGPGSYGPDGGNPPGGYGASGGYPPGGGYPPAGGYAGPGSGGYGPSQPAAYSGGGRPPGRKSPGLIIGIVVAAIVLLTAVGGIIIALTRGGQDQPVSTVTPAPQAPAPTEPAPSDPAPSDPGPSSPDPSSPGPSSPAPSSSPSSSTPTTPSPPSGDRINLGQGIFLVPADGWSLKDKGDNAALVSNGEEAFLGRVLTVKKGTNAEQLCDAYNREITKDGTDQEYQEAKPIDKMPAKKLSGASCLARVTDTSGQESLQIYVSTLISVRTDGLTVAATLLFFEQSADAVGKDASAMAASMLAGQV